MNFWPFRRKSEDTPSGALGRLVAAIRGTQSAAGIAVNDDIAMRVAAVYACVRVIAETVGSLPLNMYQRRGDGGKERAPNHPLQLLLHDRPNGWQTSLEFREQLTAHCLLRGNAYAYINWGLGDRVAELIPLHPDRVRVEQADDMSLVYIVSKPDGKESRFQQDDIFHLRGLSSDGVIGRSVLSDARDVVGAAFATQTYSGKFWANDATPSVVLSHPAKLSADAATRLKESWNAAFAGSSNARRTALLEEGMKIERLALTAEDSQFLETRKLQRSEIAGLFRVPPHMVGDLERATFSNIEHQAIEFVTHCIRPWLVRWEQAISRCLITATGTYFSEFNVDGLLRGDIQSRYQAYAIGRNWGWLSVNDIRGLENMNPVDSGDIYLQPLNMQEAGAVQEEEQDPQTLALQQQLRERLVHIADVMKARSNG